jgi:hypothetical protein
MLVPCHHVTKRRELMCCHGFVNIVKYSLRFKIEDVLAFSKTSMVAQASLYVLTKMLNIFIILFKYLISLLYIKLCLFTHNIINVIFCEMNLWACRILRSMNEMLFRFLDTSNFVLKYISSCQNASLVDTTLTIWVKVNIFLACAMLFMRLDLASNFIIFTSNTKSFFLVKRLCEHIEYRDLWTQFVGTSFWHFEFCSKTY